jgi:hypothetical protein
VGCYIPFYICSHSQHVSFAVQTISMNSNCMVQTNSPENLLSSEAKVQPIDGRDLGNTKTKHGKIMCQFELDTGPGIMMHTVQCNSMLG